MPGDSFESVTVFSLTHGGPLYSLLQRAGLMKQYWHTSLIRLILFPVIAWVPLFALVLSGGLGEQFLADFAVHIRFLITLPILLTAEEIIDRRVSEVTGHLTATQLISGGLITRYRIVTMMACRLRDSVLPEALILIIVCVAALSRWRGGLFSGITSWQESSPAGDFWYLAVSMPIFQFFLLRWLWRIIIWAWFLMQVAKLPLNMQAAHPDLMGGIGFIGEFQTCFGILAFAASSTIAGGIGELILYEDASLTSFVYIIIGYFLLALLLFFGPLVLFMPTLIRLKRTAILRYNTLATEYVREFDRKWIHHTHSGEALLGTPDIQSLSDLNNSFTTIMRLHIIPISARPVIEMLIMLVCPFLPLLLTEVPAGTITIKILRLIAGG